MSLVDATHSEHHVPEYFDAGKALGTLWHGRGLIRVFVAPM